MRTPGRAFRRSAVGVLVDVAQCKLVQVGASPAFRRVKVAGAAVAAMLVSADDGFRLLEVADVISRHVFHPFCRLSAAVAVVWAVALVVLTL